MRCLVNSLAMFLLLLWTLPVTAQDVEREAGELLAKAGAKAFDQGRYEDAARKFEQALTVMYGGKIQRASAQLLNYLGRSYAKTQRCEDALPILRRARSDEAPEPFEDARQRAEVGCMRALATSALKANKCKAAMPHLRGLEGRLDAQGERWRAKGLDTCDPQPDTLKTHTAERKVANKLFVAARAERKKHRYTRALSLYRKALAIVDDPLIRGELGELLMSRKKCKEGLKVLDNLDDEALEPSTKRSRERCRRKLGLTRRAPLSPQRIRPPRSSSPDGAQGAAGGMRPLTIGGWSAIGTGGVFAVVSAIFTGLYFAEYDKYEAAFAGYDQSLGKAFIEEQPDVAAARDTATSNSIVGFVSGGLALAAVGTGIALLLLDLEKPQEPQSALRWRPVLSPSGVGIMGRF